VGVVGWMGTQGGQVADEGVVVRNATGLQPVANTRTQPVLDVQDYLVAHRQIPSPELYRQVNNRAAARAR
jgi:hypothetical protein